MALWTIRADYDPELKVFYTFDSELPGLFADGGTLEALQRKIVERFAEMLATNTHLIDDARRLEGPHKVRLLFRHESHYPVGDTLKAPTLTDRGR